MSGETIAALSTLVTAVVSALAAALVLVLNTKATNKQKEQRDKLDEFQTLIERYEKQVARLDVQIENHQSLLQRALELNAHLREKNAGMRARCESLHSYASRLYELLQQKGVEVERPPSLVPLVASTEESQSAEEIDLDARKSEQASSIIRKAGHTPPPSAMRRQGRGSAGGTSGGDEGQDSPGGKAGGT